MSQLAADALGLLLLVAALVVFTLPASAYVSTGAGLAASGVAAILLGARYARPPAGDDADVSRETGGDT